MGWSHPPVFMSERLSMGSSVCFPFLSWKTPSFPQAVHRIPVDFLNSWGLHPHPPSIPVLQWVMAPKGRLPKTVHVHCRNPYDLPRSIHGSIPVITVLTCKVADLGLKFHPPIPIPIPIPSRQGLGLNSPRLVRPALRQVCGCRGSLWGELHSIAGDPWGIHGRITNHWLLKRLFCWRNPPFMVAG